MADFDKVEEYLDDAKAITWDTCHKIYVLMDDEQVELMRKYEYDPIITASEMSSIEMLETIKKWFDESCSLRFVSAVATNLADPNDGFTTLIGQFEEEDCEDCGESGCKGVCNDFEDEDEDEEDE
jgi:hypothetical protein